MGIYCSQVLTLRTREALLQLRQSIRGSSRLLSSWKGQDCCTWDGVTCDKVYGHVVKLQSQPKEDEYVFFAGEINSSLLHLRYLNHLDLSGIDFMNGRIPKFFGSMKQLRYLNLSFANFVGTVPRQLGNLTKLEVLDLQTYTGLVVDDAPWVSYLLSLKYLDMSGLTIANARGLLQVISSLPSLLHLSLSYCGFQNFHLSSLHLVNFTYLVHLQYLDLSGNHFQGPIPSSTFQNMTSLQHLDLSSNTFNSSIPMWFDKFPSLNKHYLKSLSLWGNQIGEEISTTQGNSSKFIDNNLESLEICDNHLKGPLPNWLVHFTSLKHILLSNNFFSGSIPSVIGSLSNLETLLLSYNGLNGSIPSSIGRLSSLITLDLSNNQLAGHIPESVGKLRALEYLDLESNHLTGVISENHFSNTSRLQYLDVSDNNNLTFKAKPTWIPPFQLQSIRMISCKFGTPFPQWIRTQVEATDITLSNASLFGSLPNWLANLTFVELDLSHNNITGPLPSISSNCSSLDLSHNLISGSLPSNLGLMYQFSTLYLNDNLINGTIPSSLCDMDRFVELDLANNKLYGNIPNCWKGSLFSLTLSFNKLSGVIPSSIGSLSDLLALHLNGNNLNGELPVALAHCTFLICSLSGLQILDMAVNNLTGTIPRCIGHMLSMSNLNQANMLGSAAAAPTQDTTTSQSASPFPETGNNVPVVEIMKGRYIEYTKNIPIGIGNMRSLESLDLSNNFLSGTIPQGISALTFLSHLNLSQNNFTGQIPKGNQIQTLDDPSIYAGNPLLCGDLLGKKCHSAEAPEASKIPYPKDTHEEDKLAKALFSVVVMLGFATGFWGFFGVLQFKKDWRHAYFSFVDLATDKAYVAIVVRVAKLKRLRQSRNA
ncbi:hypothetical protein BT93_A0984 [Corymbia citriodora subsp. variegata]|nr:hypothetical protein BT93_A0984 [Corymbia citriodora subsp. variegata]